MELSTSRHRRARGRTAAALIILVMALGITSAALLPCVAAPAGARKAQVAQPVKSWEFEQFDTDIVVNTDGSLTVRETQVANFTGSFTFLNRDLTSSKANFTGGRTYGRVRFKDIKVFDLQGQPASSVKIKSINGGKRITISFSATNTRRAWVIEYRMTGALIYGKDTNRLYFNTVSTQRDVNIKSSRTTVKLPAGVPMDKVKAVTYVDTGNPPTTHTSSREGNTLAWQSTDIKPVTNVTIDVLFPRGFVQVPLTYRAWFGAVAIALAAILGLGALALMLVLWRRKGRDFAAPELDVVRYEPPPGLRPMEVAFLMNEGTSSSDISATVVDLAIRGKLVITEQEGGGILKHKEFGFERQPGTLDDLAPFELAIMDGLFESGNSVTQDDLHEKFYTHVGGIESKLRDQVLSKDLFDGDPGSVKRHYYVIGLVLLLLIVPLFLSVAWFDPGYLYAFVPGLAISGLSVVIIGRFMSRRTAKGAEALSYVRGFKDYMGTAEREEMKFMTPENFQANLPYAMVLGVEKEWGGKFQDIYTQPPNWYRSYYPGAVFSTVYLTDSLSTMQTSIASTMTSSPSSSGGGGGGFGGGSSGGGFGGGGSSAG
jgi:uncharacterized membrane protein YgcG